MKTKGRSLALIAAVGMMLVAAVAFFGCSQSDSGASKDVPPNVSKPVFDAGAEVHEIADEYLSGGIGAETAAAKIDKALDGVKGSDGFDGDVQVFTMAYFLKESLGIEGEEARNADVSSYRDGLGHVLETGEYSERFAAFDV